MRESHEHVAPTDLMLLLIERLDSLGESSHLLVDGLFALCIRRLPLSSHLRRGVPRQAHQPRVLSAIDFVALLERDARNGLCVEVASQLGNQRRVLLFVEQPLAFAGGLLCVELHQL